MIEQEKSTIEVCVNLENQLYLWSSGIFVQLKYFHEAGGEIACISPMELKEFHLMSKNGLILLTNQETYLGDKFMANYCFCMEVLNVKLLKKVKNMCQCG